MKQISTSIYTFEKLIQKNVIYVDKTNYFYQLVTSEDGQFFCSRPRRFGKSLAISTLEAIFQGKKELFKGLYIYDKDYDWQEYPVVHLDMARMVLTDRKTMNTSLDRILKQCAENYDVLLQTSDPANMFSALLESLNKKTGKLVVLLIDEYDKPLLEHMNTPAEAEEWRTFMDSFYQIIKGAESVLRFVFITGVTKFAKVSIFSKLNNLRDITMSEDYAGMFGYTQQELEEYFAEYLDDAIERGITDDKDQVLDRAGLLELIRKWYDGFQFSPKGQRMYNPVSVGSFINEKYEFSNYWFATGTPSFLIKILRKNHIIPADVQEVIMSANAFNVFDVTKLAGIKVSKESLKQMLYQTGYLTLDGVFIKSPRMYRLRFPNMEVADSFSEQLVYAYAGDSETISLVEDLVVAAVDGDTQQMIDVLKSFFADLPYDIQIPEEKYYQSIVYTVFRLCSMDMAVEQTTNIGRIDGVLNVGDHLYIIEFKLNKTADAAIEQIDDRKYAEKYILPAKKKGQMVHKLGINFCYGKEIRNISDWKEA